MDILYFLTTDELRSWFEANHQLASEAHLGFYKKGAPIQGINYEQALDEALCFGWIDGVTHRVDDASYTVRFTPRRKKSLWSLVNIAKVESLIEQGRMTPAGMAAYEQRDMERTKAAYETNRTLSDELKEKFQQLSPEGWAFYQSQPATYLLYTSRWIMSGKREETRLKRLQELVEKSKEGKRVQLQ